MYGYRTKHAILKAYMDWQLNQVPVNLANKMSFNLLSINANTILKRGFKNLDYVRHTITNMQLDGYFDEFGDVRDGNGEIINLTVHISDKGLLDYSGRVFLIKQDEVFWKRIIDIVLTVANVIVAITAAWAIYNGNGESQRLEDRLKVLEEQVRKSAETANPNNEHL